jgi:succinate dehydrogenase / fumarate reductase, cytochrome b subunit
MKFLSSTIGLKLIMAISGIVLLGFVVGHMLGNLQIFLGEDALNQYASALHGTPALVWGTRIVILGSVFAHIYSAFTLTVRSRAARPANYGNHHWLRSSYAVRTMRWGGVILLAFIVYHILHLTVTAPVLPSEHAAEVACSHQGMEVTCGNVYSNVIKGFSFAPVAIFYIIAQVMLGLHLTHGVWSMTRSLGISNPKWTDLAEKIAVTIGGAITIGNCSIPLAVLFGFLKL